MKINRGMRNVGLKGLTYVPRVIITDKLKSYGVAKRELLPGVEHLPLLDLVGHVACLYSSIRHYRK
jgi:hypothetical protein